jgi:hypothetical protein
MSNHDIQLLALGASIGVYFMLLVQVVFGVLDDRRDRKTVRAAEAKLAVAAAEEKAST